MEHNIYMEPTADCDRVIYTASDLGRDNLLHLQEAGRLVATKPHSSHRGGLKSYLLLVICSGSGYVEYKGERYEMNAGDCALIDCMEEYSHNTSSDPWTLCWVHFYGHSMKEIYEKYFSSPERYVFHIKNISGLTQHIQEICLVANSSSNIRDLKICENIFALINCILSSPSFLSNEAELSAKWADILTQIKDYLDVHYAEHISLEDLSSRFFLNKYTMVRYFKNYFGTSPVAYLLQVRITQAKGLLRFANISIEEVAWKCGFQDANYFSRAFKKIELTSPGEYRKQWITQGENK